MESVDGKEPQDDFKSAADPEDNEWRAYNPYDLACRVSYEMQDALAKAGDVAARGADPERLEKINRHLNNGAYYLTLLEQWHEALKDGEKPEAPDAALTVMASLPVDKAAIAALYKETEALYEDRHTRIKALLDTSGGPGPQPDGPTPLP